MKTKIQTLIKSLVLMLGASVLVSTTQAGQGPAPGICTRACWGARAPKCGISNMGALTRAIIHHTAGPGDYSTDYETSKAIVRSIQNYHMDSAGMCDIAYHFLVNAGGHIYEGRNNSIPGQPRGGHDGCNNDSFGFNVMGYFHPPYNQAFTSAARGSLEAVIAWRMPSAWSPYGSGGYCSAGSVGTLDGHHRVVPTACPGNEIIPQIPGIRDGVNCRKTPGCGAPPALPRNKVSDFDGNGTDDVISFTRGTAMDVYVGTSAVPFANAFGTGTLWNGGFCTGTEIPLTGDFNGDGRTDIATFTRGATADVYVGISVNFLGANVFANGTLWNGWFCANNDIPLAGDFNGDGKDDIACFNRGTTGDVWVSLSTGSGFAPATLWNDWFCLGSEIPLVGDFNGDGRDDIATFTRGTTGDVYVGLSINFLGANVFAAVTKWNDSFCYGSEIPLVGDFNGDGRCDIATFTRGTTGDVYVGLSVNFLGADVFGGVTKWNDWCCVGSELPGVGDFNGDGRADICSFSRGGTGDVYVGISVNFLGADVFTNGALWNDWFCAGSEIPLPGPSAAISW